MSPLASWPLMALATIDDDRLTFKLSTFCRPRAVRNQHAGLVDQHRFPSLTEASGIGKDGVQLIVRQLIGKHTELALVHDDGNSDEGGGCASRRLVGLEFRIGETLGIVARDRLLEDLCEACILVGTIKKVGTEVALLHDGVDDVAVRIDEEDVVITLRLKMLEEGRVPLAVGAVVAVLLRAVEIVLLTDWVRVFVDVAPLQFAGRIVTQLGPGTGDAEQRLLGHHVGGGTTGIEPDGFEEAACLVAATVGCRLQLLVDLLIEDAALLNQTDGHGGTQDHEGKQRGGQGQLGRYTHEGSPKKVARQAFSSLTYAR